MFARAFFTGNYYAPAFFPAGGVHVFDDTVDGTAEFLALLPPFYDRATGTGVPLFPGALDPVVWPVLAAPAAWATAPYVAPLEPPVGTGFAPVLGPPTFTASSTADIPLLPPGGGARVGAALQPPESSGARGTGVPLTPPQLEAAAVLTLTAPRPQAAATSEVPLTAPAPTASSPSLTPPAPDAATFTP